MGMIGDGKKHYNHDFDGSDVEIGGCVHEFRNLVGPSTCRITYMSQGQLQVPAEIKEKVDVKHVNDPVWTHCFSARATIPRNPYIGFSAMTGGVTSKHDIHALNAYSIENKVNITF